MPRPPGDWKVFFSSLFNDDFIPALLLLNTLGGEEWMEKKERKKDNERIKRKLENIQAAIEEMIFWARNKESKQDDLI